MSENSMGRVIRYTIEEFFDKDTDMQLLVKKIVNEMQAWSMSHHPDGAKPTYKFTIINKDKEIMDCTSKNDDEIIKCIKIFTDEGSLNVSFMLEQRQIQRPKKGR